MMRVRVSTNRSIHTDRSSYLQRPTTSTRITTPAFSNVRSIHHLQRTLKPTTSRINSNLHRTQLSNHYFLESFHRYKSNQIPKETPKNPQQEEDEEIDEEFEEELEEEEIIPDLEEEEAPQKKKSNSSPASSSNLFSFLKEPSNAPKIKASPKQQAKQPQHRINEKIFAQKVKLISENGTMLGVFDTSKALQMAREKKLDLVEVSPNANPPVCKMYNYKVEQAKKEDIEKFNKRMASREKEIRFSTVIAEHDVDTKVNSMKRFLEKGWKVKVVLVWKPEKNKDLPKHQTPDIQSVGPELINNLFQRVSEVANKSPNPPTLKPNNREMETYFFPKKVPQYKPKAKFADSSKK